MTIHQPIKTFGFDRAQQSPIVQFWNETLAPKFIRFQHILVDGLARHSDAVFPNLDCRPGDKVADIGCGFGDTAMAMAQRVGQEGRVTGIDCCDAFLEFAHMEQRRAGVTNLDFVVGDAESGLPEAEYDFVFARFGTMFFTNPVAGLRNMQRSLRPGGRATHIVWRCRQDNPWLSKSRDVLLKHLPQPDANASSCGPGPFSMSDPALVHAQMNAAGFQDVTLQRIDAKVLVGREIKEAIAFQLAIGPAGEVFRTAGPEAEHKRAEIERDLRSMFEQEARDEAGIWMDSSSWIVSAHAPD